MSFLSTLLATAIPRGGAWDGGYGEEEGEVNTFRG